MQIKFSPPYIDEDVLREVKDSLLSGWITTGPKVKALEDEIKIYTHSKACNAVNSWTSGAILALKWLGVKEGDEVIVPAYTYCATAMAVMEAGAKPIMVDIDDSMTINPEEVRKAITPNTKAIIPVDFGGIPCNYKRLKEIITDIDVLKMFTPNSENQKRLGRIMLLSDSAHSLGATIGKESIAQTVDICVISLHAVKNITSAEGGIICLNLPERFDNKELYKWFKIMSLNGQTKDAFSKNQLGAWRYDVVDMGLKINLADVNAAIALAQFRKYDYLLSERKRVFDCYSKRLSNYNWAYLPYPNSNVGRFDYTSSYHLFPLRIRDFTALKRDKLIDMLAKKDIATNVHYIPLPELTLFKKLGYKAEDYPISHKTFEQEITLPLYPQLTNDQIDFLLNNLIFAHDILSKTQ